MFRGNVTLPEAYDKNEHSNSCELYEDWLDENLIVLSCIWLRIGTTDLCLIKDETIAKKAWDTLRAAHQPSGALSQLTVFQQALATRYSCDVALAKTTEKLDTLVDSFFAIKPLTEDEWRCIILLNAMAGAEFANAQSSLDTLLSAGHCLQLLWLRELSTSKYK
ncbi:hypothetical protein B0H13DRAFT_2314436 [Mycena leptocephala]|nr:hypothetical protein B0H13DRAFT_2314436 [Mycena leptocephala]